MRPYELAEAEYGQPIEEIIKGYAADGESIHATGQILGWASHGAFFRFVHRRGLHSYFLSSQQTKGSVAARAQRRGVSRSMDQCAAANPSYKRVEWRGEIATIAAHCRRFGLNFKAVRWQVAKHKRTYTEALEHVYRRDHEPKQSDK